MVQLQQLKNVLPNHIFELLEPVGVGSAFSFLMKDVYAWDWECICVSAKDQELLIFF